MTASLPRSNDDALRAVNRLRRLDYLLAGVKPHRYPDEALRAAGMFHEPKKGGEHHTTPGRVPEVSE